MKRTFTYKLNIFLFLLPALVLFIGILIAPIAMSAYYSFHEFNLVANTDMEYMGLGNYRILFSQMLTNAETGKLYAEFTVSVSVISESPPCVFGIVFE